MEISTIPRAKLSRGCDQCIKAKRKCNRGVPSCQRCTKRRILCIYRNQPLHDSRLDCNSFVEHTATAHSSQVLVPNYGDSFARGRSNYYLPSCLLLNMSQLNGTKLNVLSIDGRTIQFMLGFLRCVIWPTSSSNDDRSWGKAHNSAPSVRQVRLFNLVFLA